jgi:hypothetical protein
MYFYFFFTIHNYVADALLNNFVLFPLFFLIFFFLTISFCLYFSLWNIFKIFFFTESLLLLSVIFLTQYANIFSYETSLHYFYCQLILAAAASEAALFLGLFSHLYEQQFINRIKWSKELDTTSIYHFLVKNLNKKN